MIESFLQPGLFTNWEDVSVSTEDEVKADHAPFTFYAESSQSEKIQRIFNNTVFFIAGLKLLSFLPYASVAQAAVSTHVWNMIGGAALLQTSTILTIGAIATQAITTLALILVARKVLAVTLHFIIHPASVTHYLPSIVVDWKDSRWEEFEFLQKHKFDCRCIALNKSGIDYDAFAIEHESTKDNGKWVIVSGGNAQIGEQCITRIADKFAYLGLNTLYINGPGVVRSTGFSTSYSIGASVEAGLQFLEEVVEAEKILLYGLSLGGGAIAKAIDMHTFKKDVDYMVWSDRSFDTLSNAASGMVTSLAKPVFFLLGIELDGVAGAKKLQKLNITHIVTQNSYVVKKALLAIDDEELIVDPAEVDPAEIDAGSLPLDGDIDEDGEDGVISNAASLYVGLRKAGIDDSDRLKCYGGPYIDHNGDLPKVIMDLVEADIQDFLS